MDAALWKRSVEALRSRNHETLALMRSQMLHSIASTAITFGEIHEALRNVDEAIEIDRELGYSRALAFANAVKACILCLQGRLTEARTCMVAALAEPDMFVVRLELAVGASPVPIALDDPDLAERCLSDDLLSEVRSAGMMSAASTMEGMRSAWLFARGRAEEARRLLNVAVDGESHQFNDVHFWPIAARFVDDAQLIRLQTLCSARARNPDDRVAQACGALLDATRARREHNSQNSELAQLAVSRYRALEWPLLEALAFEMAGRIQEALDLYRRCGSVSDIRRLEMGRSPAKARSAGGSRLTPREREVAALVAKGLTNRTIASNLTVSEKTVEKYVSAIYAKLGFSTRAQLAAHVARGEATDEERARNVTIRASAARGLSSDSDNRKSD